MLELYTAIAITTFLFYIAYKGNQPKPKSLAGRDYKGRYTRSVHMVKRTTRTIPVTINGKPEGTIIL